MPETYLKWRTINCQESLAKNSIKILANNLKTWSTNLAMHIVGQFLIATNVIDQSVFMDHSIEKFVAKFKSIPFKIIQQ